MIAAIYWLGIIAAIWVNVTALTLLTHHWSLSLRRLARFDETLGGHRPSRCGRSTWGTVSRSEMKERLPVRAFPRRFPFAGFH